MVKLLLFCFAWLFCFCFFLFFSFLWFFFLFEIPGKPRRLKFFCKEEAKDTGCCRGEVCPQENPLGLGVSWIPESLTAWSGAALEKATWLTVAFSLIKKKFLSHQDAKVCLFLLNGLSQVQIFILIKHWRARKQNGDSVYISVVGSSVLTYSFQQRSPEPARTSA